MASQDTEPAIVVQTLGISHAHTPPGPETLLYGPGALVEGMPEPDSIPVPTSSIVVRRQIAEIKQVVEQLSWRAQFGNRREGFGIESAAAELARQILPSGGFGTLVRQGLHPHFLIEDDLASEVPWEVLDDPGGTTGKLAVDRHLTYRVRGGEPPSAAGNAFLLIEDPTQNTSSGRSDPDGKVAAHLVRLKEMLRQHGYDVLRLKGRNATVARMKAAIQDPNVVGLYYFGHGFFPDQANEGRLALADGPLLAREIDAARPNIRFVFLNACHSAARGENWTLERKSRSVAESFARGGPEKAVIAPLFPVINEQAAAAAMCFFDLALQDKPLGECLRAARLESLRRYEQDMPDISWMAYRFFGNGRRRLPQPGSAPTATAKGMETPTQSRVFAGDERKLNLDVFSCSPEGALFRAAKRRNLQGRKLVTPTDLLAGLTRTGDLTRFAFRQLKVDPDEVYERLLTTVEDGEPADDITLSGDNPEPKSTTAESETPPDEDENATAWMAELKRMFAQLLIREESQLTQSAIDLLVRADAAAQRRGNGQDQRIAEQDLLLAFSAGDRWAVEAQVGLPPPDNLRAWLAQSPEQRSVDENGGLVLALLSPDAVQVIETAHQQAQQRGALPIPNRLLLASFLCDPEGYSARHCRQHGVDAKQLAGLLIAATPAAAPKTFGLTHEACQRVVLPCIAKASAFRTQFGLKTIDTMMLFKAYCEVASDGFVNTLKSPELPDGIRVDLRSIGAAIHLKTELGIPIPVNGAAGKLFPDTAVDATVRQVFAAAAHIAAIQGYQEICSPHLFVALVSYGSGSLRAKLEQGPLTCDQLVLNLLSVVASRARKAAGATTVRLGPTVRRVLAEAKKAARAAGKREVCEQDLVRVLLSQRDGNVVQTLKAVGFGPLLDKLLDTAPPS